MYSWRKNHTATLLLNGTVLVMRGDACNWFNGPCVKTGAELYLSSMRQW